MEKKPIYKKWWFWLIIVLVVGSIAGGKKSNITNVNATKNMKESIFLEGSNGREFYNILCDVAGVKSTEAQDTGETLIYETVDNSYSIEVESNKETNEINYVRLMAFEKENYENLFLAISRLEYENNNKEQCFNWINDNLGKEAKTKIGDANIELKLGSNDIPILELYTDGNEQFQKEQLDKLF